MKRDMELVRQILLEAEQCGDPFGLDDLEVDGRTEQEVGYHIRIMQQGGLVEAREHTRLSSQAQLWHAIQLTWAGHEFLDAARNQSVWTQAMGRIGGAVGSVSLAVLQALLVDVAKKQLGIA